MSPINRGSQSPLCSGNERPRPFATPVSGTGRNEIAGCNAYGESGEGLTGQQSPFTDCRARFPGPRSGIEDPDKTTDPRGQDSSMISFELTEEQTLTVDTLSGFAREVLAPAARECDEARHIPQDLLDTGWSLGLVVSAIPEAYGGGGSDRSPVTGALVLEALGTGCASLGAALMAPALFVNPLIDFGTAKQKADHLPRFTRATYQPATMALHEGQMSFAPARMMTQAEKHSGGWTLRGRKRLVPFGMSADHILVIARSSSREGLDGLDAFIVPADAAGVSITPESGTMGMASVPFAQLDLDNVSLSADARLGGEQGCDMRRILNAARIGSRSLAVGLSRAVTDFAIPYARDRVAFGEPIGRKQAIAFMLADMHSSCETMRWMVWKAASELEHGRDAARETVLAETIVDRYGMKTADDGLQVFGGHGYIRDLPLEMWLRNMRTLTVHNALASV